MFTLPPKGTLAREYISSGNMLITKVTLKKT